MPQKVANLSHKFLLQGTTVKEWLVKLGVRFLLFRKKIGL